MRFSGTGSQISHHFVPRRAMVQRLSLTPPASITTSPFRRPVRLYRGSNSDGARFFRWRARFHHGRTSVGGTSLHSRSCKVRADGGSCSIVLPGTELALKATAPSGWRFTEGKRERQNSIIVGVILTAVLAVIVVVAGRYTVLPGMAAQSGSQNVSANGAAKAIGLETFREIAKAQMPMVVNIRTESRRQTRGLSESS